MRERGDCRCLHEPFMYYYYIHLGRRSFPHFEVSPDQPKTFGDVVGLIRGASRRQPVFVKDMAYYVMPEITRHPDMAGRFRHVFLIREPRRALMSYHRLDPDFSCEEAGLEAQWRLFRWITAETGTEPPVVRAEDIQRDPRGVVGALWRHLGLGFVEEAFSWQAGTTPREWEHVGTWHERTARHSGIARDTRDDAEVRAEFAAAAGNAPVLRDYLEHHWPYYLELSSRSLSVRR